MPENQKGRLIDMMLELLIVVCIAALIIVIVVLTWLAVSSVVEDFVCSKMPHLIMS